jgi:hypothetical protein
MRRRVGPIFWLEACLATAFCLLAALTAVWPDWIEEIFHVDPDQGSGALEWMIVVVFGIVGVSSVVMARREWLRAPVVET